MDALTDYLKAMEDEFAKVPGLKGYQNFNASRINGKARANRWFKLTDINCFYALLTMACAACWVLAELG